MVVPCQCEVMFQVLDSKIFASSFIEYTCTLLWHVFVRHSARNNALLAPTKYSLSRIIIKTTIVPQTNDCMNTGLTALEENSEMWNYQFI